MRKDTEHGFGKSNVNRMVIRKDKDVHGLSIGPAMLALRDHGSKGIDAQDVGLYVQMGNHQRVLGGARGGGQDQPEACEQNNQLQESSTAPMLQGICRGILGDPRTANMLGLRGHYSAAGFFTRSPCSIGILVLKAARLGL